MAKDFIEKLEERRMGIANWLNENAPYIDSDQNHLDEVCAERGYWHFGYMTALDDALKLIRDDVKKLQAENRSMAESRRWNIQSDGSNGFFICVCDHPKDTPCDFYRYKFVGK